VEQLSSAVTLNTLPDVPHTFGTSNDLHLHIIMLHLTHFLSLASALAFSTSQTLLRKTEQNGIRTVQTVLYTLTRQCCCNTAAGWQADLGQGHSIKPTGTVTILFKRN